MTQNSTDARAPAFEEKLGALSEEGLSESEQPIAPDQFDERYVTTKAEIYAYYWCVELLARGP